jgi:hypothetical protein
VVLEQLRKAIDEVGEIVATLDPACIDGHLARALLDEFARGQRITAAGTALVARRVDETGTFDRSRHRSAAHYLAKITGTSVGVATATVKASHLLEELPATDGALRAGRLSTTQVTLVAEAAAADPSAEPRLLDSAAHDGIRGLRATSARVLAAAADDADARYERIRKARSFRHWADLDGTGRIDVRGPLDLTTRVAKALDVYEKEIFEAARGAETREPAEAMKFDALVAMADASVGPTTARSTGSGTTVTVRVDHRAFATGTLERGEVCEIVGVGPIPVSVAQRLADDAFLKALITDGADVLSVAHLGRTIPAHLRTALDELFPECTLEGCHVNSHLEIDHNEPIEAGGLTELANLNKLCPYHHDEKHRRKLRLVGDGLNKRFVPAAEWLPPDRSPPARSVPLAAV